MTNGETFPDVLIKGIHGRTVDQHEKNVMVASLSGIISETDIIRQLKNEVELG